MALNRLDIGLMLAVAGLLPVAVLPAVARQVPAGTPVPAVRLAAREARALLRVRTDRGEVAAVRAMRPGLSLVTALLAVRELDG